MKSPTLRTIAAVAGGFLAAALFWMTVTFLFSLDAPDAPDAIDVQGAQHFTVYGKR